MSLIRRAPLRVGVVVDGHAGFVHELLEDWQQHFEPSVFANVPVSLPFAEGRINGWRLKRALARFRDQHDITFCEWAGPLTVVLSHLRSQKPLIVRLHSWELFEYAPQVNWGSVARVILVSESMRRRFCALHPEQAAKTRVVNNGVDLARFRPPGEREFSGELGMLGNIIPIKRVYEVVLALTEMIRQDNRLRLHIGGKQGQGYEGQRYYASLRRAVELLSLQDRVVFHGHVGDAPEWLRRVDVLISNSFWEGQQVALLEAMASGCYCLSHFWDGADEVLPDEQVYSTNSELGAKVLAYCQMSEGERRALQARMRATAVEKFDIERNKREIRAIIEHATKQERKTLSTLR